MGTSTSKNTRKKSVEEAGGKLGDIIREYLAFDKFQSELNPPIQQNASFDSGIPLVPSQKRVPWTMVGLDRWVMEIAGQIGAPLQQVDRIPREGNSTIGQGNNGLFGKLSNGVQMYALGTFADCEIHSFLTCISSNFRRLEASPRSAIASLFRRQVLPRLSVFNAEFRRELMGNGFLPDNIGQLLADKIGIGIVFIKKTCTSPQNPFSFYFHGEDRASAIVIHGNQFHFTPVCFEGSYLIPRARVLAAQQYFNQHLEEESGRRIQACQSKRNNVKRSNIQDWACTACTYINIGMSERCAMCGSSRNAFVKNQIPQQMAAAGQLTLAGLGKLSPEQILGINASTITNDALQIAVVIRQSEIQNEMNRAAENAQNSNMQRLLQSTRKLYDLQESDISNFLKKENLDLIETKGDGSCFFYAIEGYGLIKGIRKNRNSEPAVLSSNDAQLRAVVANDILQNSHNIYLPFLGDKSAEEHSDLIRQCIELGYRENVWATEVDVAALANHFKISIIVHNWALENKNEFHIGENLYMHGEPIIHLLRTENPDGSGGHYQLLMPKDDPHYLALQDSVLGQGIPISLPLSESGLDLSRYQPFSVVGRAAQAAASSSPRPLPGYAKAAARNFEQFSLNPPARSALNNGRAAQAASPNNGRVAQAAASSSPDERYIANLLTQISKLQEDIQNQSKRPTTPAIETYLKRATDQLNRRLQKAKNLGLSLGGTHKRKTHKRKTHKRKIQKRKTQRRKTRHNKNKSRRRL